MKTPRFIPWMLLAAFCTAIGLLAGSETKISTAASLVPSTLVGHAWALFEGAGTSTMRFFSNSRYEKVTGTSVETGYYTPTLSGNSWIVAATKSDGSLTVQYTFSFTSSAEGTVTMTRAGSRTSAAFVESNVPSALLKSIDITNNVSLAGPSHYHIDLSGGSTGVFNIKLPGYGDGTYLYTPNVTSAKLVLTYTNADIAGDIDDLTLEFPSSGSGGLGKQSGIQRIAGRTNGVSGVFNFTTVP
jgi:hypothetical protein